jgi:hypothetical protein
MDSDHGRERLAALSLPGCPSAAPRAICVRQCEHTPSSWYSVRPVVLPRDHPPPRRGVWPKTDGKSIWFFRYSSERKSPTVLFTTDLPTLRKLHPDMQLLEEFSEIAKNAQSSWSPSRASPREFSQLLLTVGGETRSPVSLTGMNQSRFGSTFSDPLAVGDQSVDRDDVEREDG